MDYKETAAQIIDASDGVFIEATRDKECKSCTALKLQRLKNLVDLMYGQYEEYLELEDDSGR